MKIQHWLVVAVTLCGFLATGTAAKAQDPGYGYPSSYGFGPAYQFRNRLPTPPYFAIFPPVYYGERYQRPYGDSPYAAMSTLRANPSYQPTPKPSVSQTVFNPYCAPNAPADATAPVHSGSQPLATTSGKTVTIFNPYVVNDESVTPESVASDADGNRSIAAK